MKNFMLYLRSNNNGACYDYHYSDGILWRYSDNKVVAFAEIDDKTLEQINNATDETYKDIKIKWISR